MSGFGPIPQGSSTSASLRPGGNSEARDFGTEPFFTRDNLPWGWRESADGIAKDARSGRLDLSAGMLRNEQGELPIFAAVAEARDWLSKKPQERGYLPPSGLKEFRDAATNFLFPGLDGMHERAYTAQTLGAAGALRLAADCLRRLGLAENIFVSAESWADHRRIFERAGLQVNTYPYLSSSASGVDVDRLLSAFAKIPRKSVILLQASCHNPTGYDLAPSAWKEILAEAERRRLLPLFDVAYPGLGQGLRADLFPLHWCAGLGIDFIAATSYCKTFALYDGRLGALTAVVSGPEVRERFESQIKIEIQASYSSPPRHDAAIVAKVLKDPRLSLKWSAELENQREELQARRRCLVERLASLGAPEQILCIGAQRGLFGWTGLSRDACNQLADKFAIYIPSNGRICIGAIPTRRIDDVAFALTEVSGALRRA